MPQLARIEPSCPFAPQIAKILVEFNDIFNDEPLTQPSKLPPMRILLKPNASPYSRHPHRLPKPDAQFLKEEMARLLGQGIIRRSTSPWSAPAFIVKSKSRDPRVVIDYTALNSRIQGLSNKLVYLVSSM
jgi:hypothetical protein